MGNKGETHSEGVNDKVENYEVTDDELKKTTVFDDVFRTMLDKMPEVVIPVINEVFNTSYRDDEKITHYKNEHISKKGKVITDSCIGIQDRMYHLECQSTVDSIMVLRMIEYDFGIALNQAHKNGEYYEMEFPRSCVLYLRHNSKTPDELMLKVNLPDGNVLDYRVPTVKVQMYTKDQIFQKKLLMFLPFYIMRYEKEFDSIEKEPKKLEALINEYEDIRNKLGVMCEESEKSVLYNDLIEMIVQISDYMLIKSRRLKERIGRTMAGQVLKLFSEKVAEYEENIIELEKKKADFEAAKADLESEKADLESEKADLESKKADLESEKAKLKEQEAEIIRKKQELAKIDMLSDVKIYVKLLNKKVLDLSKVLELTGVKESEFLGMVKEIGLSIDE